MVFRTSDVRKRALDIAAPPYRGKVVAIYYWATWVDHCKERMDALGEVYAKWGSRGFDVIGVCSDKTPDTMQAFLVPEAGKPSPYKWAHVYDAGGKLTNDMGVMTLPLMILVDQKGNVVSNNIYADGLDAELQRLLGAAAGAANSPATAQSTAAPTGR
jgi:hypothetical protein